MTVVVVLRKTGLGTPCELTQPNNNLSLFNCLIIKTLVKGFIGLPGM
jgi:hypothetical protein